MLSDVAAAEVARRRRAAGLNREQLAERCDERGHPLSAAAIANIETGRRDTSGKRRRELSVDELVALADALNTTPGLLVFPLGQQPTTQLPTGLGTETWPALLWFGGHGDHPSTNKDGRPATDRHPIELFTTYHQAKLRLHNAQTKVANLQRHPRRDNPDMAEILQWAQEAAGEAEQAVEHARQMIVHHQLTPPPEPLPSEAAS